MKNKFTLIELLVVVSIIGVLLTILLHSLSDVRKKSMQSVCLSNQRQLGIAAFSYISKNDGYAPLHEDVNGKRWYHRLVPAYLPEGKIYDNTSSLQSCPSSVEISREWHSGIAISITACGDLDSAYNYPKPVYQATADETFLFIDSYSNWPRMRQYYLEPDKVEFGEENLIIAKHLRKANVSFLDGSSKAKSPSYLYERNYISHTFWDLEK